MELYQTTRQIINYDAGIVLIDLHQLNVKTTSDNTNQRHWIRGNLMSTKNRTRRTTTRNIRFPNQMIEQINIALEQKRVREFLSLGHWSLPSETNVRKESIHQIKKWWRMNIPRSSLRTGRYCKSFAFNYAEGGQAVIELQFYHFPDSDRLRVGSVTD